MEINHTDNLIVYLDLEDTIIDTYIKKEDMINVKSVQSFLDKYNISEVDIFSFVMQNDSLISHFYNDLNKTRSLYQKICDTFCIKINNVLTLDQMIRYSSQIRKIDTIPRRDYFEYFGKERAFIDMCKFNIVRYNLNNNSFVLIDDDVFTQTIEFEFKNTKNYIYLINVNDL